MVRFFIFIFFFTLTLQAVRANQDHLLADDMPSQSQALIDAARKKDIVGIKNALNAGANPDFQDAFNETPLLVSAGLNDIEAVKVLLDAGANPHGTQNTSPLMRASLRGHIKIVRLFLALGVDPNKPNERTGSIALIPAVTNGHIEVVQELLMAGADPNLSNSILGSTSLIMASGNHNIPIMKMLLAFGADPNMPNKSGLTPFLVSAKNSIQLMELLLSYGADPYTRSSNDQTALYTAIRSNRASTVQFIFDLFNIEENVGTYVTLQEIETSLTNVIKRRYSINENGRSMAHAAMLREAFGFCMECFIESFQNNNLIIMSLLLQAGADPHIVDEYGYTPIMHSVLAKDIEGLKVLLTHGADPCYQNDYGYSALKIADMQSPIDAQYAEIAGLIRETTQCLQ